LMMSAARRLRDPVSGTAGIASGVASGDASGMMSFGRVSTDGSVELIPVAVGAEGNL
jgi:hypothetical protein